MSVVSKKVRVMPWGGEVYLELPIYKRSANKFYARHASTAEGRQYLEFSKFGPKPNAENETYSQKLRLFNPVHWVQIKRHVEGELARSIGWDVKAAEVELEAL